MKNFILVVIFTAFTALVFSAPFEALAHPGRTDRKGGHTCRTNCPKWGFKYGQHHFHAKKYRSYR
ncbi:MAG: YHYH domain-containing protein [Candidatus Niyogibacteria bacterium]|nr:MAG: YHYH domain-containing protein [Candidatus Niyogibacteria bacterium]